MTRKTLVIDLNRCTGCFGCEVTCKYENDIPLGERWNRLMTIGPMGKFPDVSMYFLPMQCQQCENAPCINVCPTGASYRTDDGVVLIDKEKCIGCRYCMMACPYGVRNFNKEEKVVEKCTLCYHNTSVGIDPQCVQNCCAQARYYGDLDDPESSASKALAAADPDSIHYMFDVGNKPTCAYILDSKYAEWQDLKGAMN